MFPSTIQLWPIVGVTTLIFFGLVTIFFCIHWFKMKPKKSQLYTIEEIPSPRKNSLFEIVNIYRHFGNYDDSHNRLLKSDQLDTEKDNLFDSTDLSNNFTNSLLRIASEGDEMYSRASTGSLRSYYSTNITRSNSKCSFVSCSEGSDPGEIV